MGGSGGRMKALSRKFGDRRIVGFLLVAPNRF
jgi:hypothetical protein